MENEEGGVLEKKRGDHRMIMIWPPFLFYHWCVSLGTDIMILTVYCSVWKGRQVYQICMVKTALFMVSYPRRQTTFIRTCVASLFISLMECDQQTNHDVVVSHSSIWIRARNTKRKKKKNDPPVHQSVLRPIWRTHARSIEIINSRNFHACTKLNNNFKLFKLNCQIKFKWNQI